MWWVPFCGYLFRPPSGPTLARSRAIRQGFKPPHHTRRRHRLSSRHMQPTPAVQLPRTPPPQHRPPRRVRVRLMQQPAQPVPDLTPRLHQPMTPLTQRERVRDVTNRRAGRAARASRRTVMHLDSAGQTPGAAAVVDSERSSMHSRGERAARHLLPAVVAGDAADAVPGAGGGAVPAAALGVVPEQVGGGRGEPGTTEPANRRGDPHDAASRCSARHSFAGCVLCSLDI